MTYSIFETFRYAFTHEILQHLNVHNIFVFPNTQNVTYGEMIFFSHPSLPAKWFAYFYWLKVSKCMHLWSSMWDPCLEDLFSLRFYISFMKWTCWPTWRFFFRMSGTESLFLVYTWWHVYLNAAIQASCWECTFCCVHWTSKSVTLGKSTVLSSSFLFHFPDCIFLHTEQKEHWKRQIVCSQDASLSKKCEKSRRQSEMS